MRAARSVEALDTAGRQPHSELARSFDDQHLREALTDQLVGPGQPNNKRQGAPG